ncbi:protein of unknown function [Kyrpidia spormannii]|uniref:Uncharacterized protein n=1 Tax=Kyrpidia spormannii TaxID=2055160 RepID=A0ACA8ZFD4_9BACL|nr:protein of unknown function [Kyrpidia spormannii]
MSFQQVQILYSYARAHYNSTNFTSLANPFHPADEHLGGGNGN